MPNSPENTIAELLERVLLGISVGEPTASEPMAHLLEVLETWLPAALAKGYPEWKRESIDGFQLAHAGQHGGNQILLAGTCILISNQTVTPFRLRIGRGDLEGQLSLQLRLGVPGGGGLGISGPPVHSSKALKLLWGGLLPGDHVDWIYRLGDIEVSEH
ncbi:MAG: hypothetical protein R3F33_15625 [Planctomycetota bacterium]